MNQNKSLRLPNYIAIGIIVCYFIAGLFITPDYGVNWDDPAQRLNGMMNYNYLSHTDRETLINSTDRYHGPAFEILLVAVENALHIKEPHDIFLMRHYMVSLFFISVLIAFFLFCRGLFENSWMGLLGMAMLLLTPRIFAESFYNPKDIVFLGGMVWAIYSLWGFCGSPTYRNAIFHAFTCAFATDVRVIGILFLPITIGLFIFYIYNNKMLLKDIWISAVLYLLAFWGFMILMWPILMEGLFVHLWAAYQQMSDYKLWLGYNTYFGHSYRSDHTPWHYHWIWMLITIPEIYILLFLTGIFIFFAKILTHKPKDQREKLPASKPTGQREKILASKPHGRREKILAGKPKGQREKIASHKSIGPRKSLFILISLFFIFFPLVFRSITHGVVLDAWRHIYFVYPFFIVLVLYASHELLSIKQKILRLCGVGLILVALCDCAISIITMHPYEYTYFNHIANNVFKPIDKKIEMDYWGVSYKNGLEKVFAHTQDRPKVNVYFPDEVGMYNYQSLDPKLQSHFEYVTQIDSIDYFLTNYRNMYGNAQKLPKPTDSICAQGNIVLGIYKLKNGVPQY